MQVAKWSDIYSWRSGQCLSVCSPNAIIHFENRRSSGKLSYDSFILNVSSGRGVIRWVSDKKRQSK